MDESDKTDESAGFSIDQRHVIARFEIEAAGIRNRGRQESRMVWQQHIGP